jgi:polyhydroxyalkanoate synthase
MTSAGSSDGETWPRIGTTPAELVLERGRVRVLRYRPNAPSSGPPFLLVMPVINRAYIADLTPATSLVAAFQEAGIDTFLVDWGKPGLADRDVGLDEIVTRELPAIERSVLEVSGAPELVLGGYCLGGTIAVCRAARGAGATSARERARHAGLVTWHAPVSFADAGLLGTYTAPANFPVEALLAAFGNMPGWLLQQGFSMGKPLQQLAKYRRLWERLQDDRNLERPETRDAFEEFIALERWNSDNVPVTGAFYRRLITDLYRGNRLVQGTLTIRGEDVSLASITCPVLVVVAKDDPICLPHQARALVEHVASAEKSVHEVTGGHVRSLTGPKARHPFARMLASWIAARRTP